MPSISRRSSVSARFGTSKQTWWKPSPLLSRKRATPVDVVGRLDQLDLRLADAQERDPDAVRRDVHDRLELEAERVAPEAEGVLDRADDQRDMMDLAERADVLGQWGARGIADLRSAGAGDVPAMTSASRWQGTLRRMDPDDQPRPPSGLAVPARLPAGLARLRRRHDRAASAGAQPHVTVLYPFIPCASLICTSTLRSNRSTPIGKQLPTLTTWLGNLILGFIPKQ